MKFKKTEKEIIKAIVKYGENNKSLAEVLHESKLLEKRGIAIIHHSNINYVFLDKTKYEDWFNNDALSYIAELMSLIDMLIDHRLIVVVPFANTDTKTIGVNGLRGIKPYQYVTGDGETICLEDRLLNWFDLKGHQKCWPCHYTEKEMPLAHFFKYPFSVSEELRDLVNHGFRTEEERRFRIQVRLTWISIAVAIGIGLLGLLK